jgi:hypothetical protein
MQLLDALHAAQKAQDILDTTASARRLMTFSAMEQSAVETSVQAPPVQPLVMAPPLRDAPRLHVTVILSS